MPDAGNLCRRDNTRALCSTDFNNLCGCSFGMHIAHQHAKAQRPVLGRFAAPRGFMSLILVFARKWVGCYRVLRCSKAFSFADSIR